MSKTRHRQNAFGWNPPKLKKDDHLPINPPQSVVSATDCTGLTRQPLANESECADTAALYATVPLKPQGNIGKDNPKNDPGETGYHDVSSSPSPS